jgi:hypothetical protein
VRKWISRQRAGIPLEAFVQRPGAALTVIAPLVLKAIDTSGACSQRELVRFATAHLPGRVHEALVQEQIGEALGELFQRRAIATRGEAEGRVYFRRDSFVRRCT